MGKVVLDMTMSLDGFIAGPNISSEIPMGENGERLHEWIFNGTNRNTLIVKEMFSSQGAVILGRRTFDLGEPHWGGDTPFHSPSFVITSKAAGKKISSKGNVYTFVDNGIESALMQAKEAAGDKNVLIMGGANTAQQYIKAGLVEVMHIRIVNLLMGDGIRLFDNIGNDHIEWSRMQVVEGEGVTHISYGILDR